MNADMETAVAAGAALFDDQCPGWAQHIDLGRLDMSCVDDDIAGQLDAAGIDRPQVDQGAASIGMDIAGPVVDSEQMLEAYCELDSLWAEQVMARRQPAGGAA